MAEETLDNPTPTGQFTYIVERMEENENFLYTNAKSALGEVAELVNDAIDHVGHLINRAESRQEYTDEGKLVVNNVASLVFQKLYSEHSLKK